MESCCRNAHRNGPGLTLHTIYKNSQSGLWKLYRYSGKMGLAFLAATLYNNHIVMFLSIYPY